MTDPNAAGRASLIQRFLGRLRFPQLFAVLATLWVADLIVPDLIPFLDELFLGVLTAMFGLWKKDGPPQTVDSAAKPPTKNVTPQH
jgi:hypothetical protein